MVVIGMQGGVKGELNLGHLLAKRGTISATALRGRDEADKARIVSSTVENIWPLLQSKEITPHIDHTLPLAEAAAALQKIQDGTITGKLVLTV